MTIWGQASSPTTLYIDKGAITIGSTSISGYDQNGNQVTATNANGYIITQTDASTPTSNTITVNDNYSGTITLNNVNITTSQEKAVPFNADKAGQVTLRLGGENKLIVNYTGESSYTPGLATPWGNGCGITIEDDPNIAETGTLETQGCPKSPGIGLIYQGLTNFASGSYITINSGIITATGVNGNGNSGAGIGTSRGNSEIKYGGTITINGGIVTATGGAKASGIGGGDLMNGGTAIINGGTVIATGGKSSIGNGNGNSKTNSFTTGTSGHAFIIADKGISDQTKQQDWNGVIFLTKETGKIYGKNIGITTSATIPNGYTLTIGQGETLTIDGCTLTVATGGTLTNNGGTIITLNGGKIEGYSGTVASSGYKITCHANNGISPEETKVQYTTGQTTTIANPFSAPQYQKFKGWYANAADEAGGPVTTVSSSTDLYAHWEPNTFTLNTLTVPTLTYGTAMQSITLSSLLPTDAVTNCGEITFSASGLPTGLTCNNGVISGTPAAASTDEGSKVTITATAANTSTVEQKVTFKVNKAPLTVTPKSDQILYKGEAPEFEHSGEVNSEEADFEGELSVNTGNNNTIEQGDLQLKDNDTFLAANYELKMSSQAVTCTYHDIEPENVPAMITASTSNPLTKVGDVGWYDGHVTLTAPEGFTIRLTENTDKGTGNTELTVEDEGLHTVFYTLTRREQDYPETATFGIDLNAPTVSVRNNYLAFTLTATDGEGSGIASVKIDGMDVTLTDGEYKGNASAGTHTYLVTDKVGRKTEGSFTLTAYVPPYVPSYYDLRFEANDSVRLEADRTNVVEGSSFTFTAEAAEGYDPATLVVEYRKGRSGSWQTLKAESSGKYRIRSIYSDIYIRASVRPLDDPTALETVGDGKSHIRTGGGIVYIETPVPQRVTVFTLDGRLIRHESLPAGNSRLYGLPAGLYVIRLQDGTTVKGFVRR